MKHLLVLLLLQIVSLCIAVQCQNLSEVDKGWKWVIPLKTQKTEIEKAFGQSITKDKNSSYQTYVTDFGKITVAYTGEKEYVEECSCIVSAGTVLTTFISPKRFKLSELNLDLSKFEKNDKYSPREISYFSEKDGILIATEIVEMEDKSKIERVIALEYRPSTILCVTARCNRQTELNKSDRIITCETNKSNVRKSIEGFNFKR